MISVVIPARNAAPTVAATLDSLISDRALIGQVLLVDDGSTDETVAVAGEAAERIGLPLETIKVQAGNAGAARNAGLGAVREAHVFFLDADDEVVPGGLTLLHEALQRNPQAELAIGSSIHRGQATKLKRPGRYGGDRMANARRYLANRLRSITMGSALLAASATANVRFPTGARVDEDTCYWAAVLTRARPVTIDAPVLIYNIDEARMAERFLTEPRKVLLGISQAIDRLADHGIDRETLQRRKAWIALRIARQLIRKERYGEAAGMMRAVMANASLRRSLKALQYNAKIRAGLRSPRCAPATDRTGKVGSVLILTVDPAFPPISGADLRNVQNASAAADAGPVLLVSLLPQTDDPSQTAPGIRTASLTRPQEGRARSLSRRSAALQPRVTGKALVRLEALMREFRPDTVLVEGIPLFQLIEAVRPLAPRLILDMHNVESELAGQLSPGQPRRRFGWLMTSEADRIAALERRALSLVDRVWVCSQEDRERLVRKFAPAIPVDVVPNGIPRPHAMPAQPLPLPDGASGMPVMVFVGHLAYAPNVEAARRLALAILPEVRQALPEARLILAGRQADAVAAELGGLDAVEIIPDPEDLGPIFRRGHVSVAPLSAGGGTRIKILEAMAWGLPVVATPLAAEGQGFVNGEDIVLAESDADLAGTIVALSRDPERMQRMRAGARQNALLRFGPKAIEQAVRRGLGLPVSDTRATGRKSPSTD